MIVVTNCMSAIFTLLFVDTATSFFSFLCITDSSFADLRYYVPYQDTLSDVDFFGSCTVPNSTKMKTVNL